MAENSENAPKHSYNHDCADSLKARLDEAVAFRTDVHAILEPLRRKVTSHGARFFIGSSVVPVDLSASYEPVLITLRRIVNERSEPKPKVKRLVKELDDYRRREGFMERELRLLHGVPQGSLAFMVQHFVRQYKTLLAQVEGAERQLEEIDQERRVLEQRATTAEAAERSANKVILELKEMNAKAIGMNEALLAEKELRVEAEAKQMELTDTLVALSKDNVALLKENAKLRATVVKTDMDSMSEAAGWESNYHDTLRQLREMTKERDELRVSFQKVEASRDEYYRNLHVVQKERNAEINRRVEVEARLQAIADSLDRERGLAEALHQENNKLRSLIPGWRS